MRPQEIKGRAGYGPAFLSLTIPKGSSLLLLLLRAVGRESEAHPAFSIIPSLNFERFFTGSQAQLRNEIRINKRLSALYQNISPEENYRVQDVTMCFEKPVIFPISALSPYMHMFMMPPA
jgi:hypothetical protein